MQVLALLPQISRMHGVRVRVPTKATQGQRADVAYAKLLRACDLYRSLSNIGQLFSFFEMSSRCKPLTALVRGLGHDIC